jgi:nicotinamidase-related amidase
MSGPAGHLVVVDLQHVFADASSGWHVPRFSEIVAPVRQLVAAFEPAVTFTRFVADLSPRGAWREYYRRWPFALKPPSDELYALAEPFDGRPTLDRSTFGKWGTELADRVGDELVLVGVSTDCCVISTALPAADAGVHVRVVAEACAGATDDTHDQALHVMSRYSPLIDVVGVGEVLAS